MTATTLAGLKPEIPIPFGNNAPISDVPKGNSTGGDGANTSMCWYGGFPLKYGLPIQEGGKYVTRAEMNSILNALSKFLFFIQDGGSILFSQDVSSDIGGYANGAVLWYFPANADPILIESQKDGNTTVPSLGEGGSEVTIRLDDTTDYDWKKIDMGGLPLSGGTMTGGSPAIKCASGSSLSLVSGTSTASAPFITMYGPQAPANGGSIVIRPTASGSVRPRLSIGQSGVKYAKNDSADLKQIATGVRTAVSDAPTYADADGIIDISTKMPAGYKIGESYREKVELDSSQVGIGSWYEIQQDCAILITCNIPWDSHSGVLLAWNEFPNGVQVCGTTGAGSDVYLNCSFSATVKAGVRVKLFKTSGNPPTATLYMFY